jgi:hypothetical protein
MEVLGLGSMLVLPARQLENGERLYDRLTVSVRALCTHGMENVTPSVLKYSLHFEI